MIAMPSSKFNRRPVPRLRPPICVPPAGSCLPPFDRRRPPKIRGYVNWTDADPIAPVAAYALITAGPRTPGGDYSGQADFSNGYLGVTVHDNWPTPTVLVSIWVHDPWRTPEWHHWPDVAMPLDEPFDTHLLTTIYLPVNDFRIARFML